MRACRLCFSVSGLFHVMRCPLASFCCHKVRTLSLSLAVPHCACAARSQDPRLGWWTASGFHAQAALWAAAGPAAWRGDSSPFGCVLSAGMAGSHGGYLFNFWQPLDTVPQVTNLHPRSGQRVPCPRTLLSIGQLPSFSLDCWTAGGDVRFHDDDRGPQVSTRRFSSSLSRKPSQLGL